MSFDYYGRWVDYQVALENWRIATVKHGIDQEARRKAYYRRIEPILRSLLIALDFQIRRSENDGLKYVIYRLGHNTSQDKVWIPTATYRANEKFPYSLPFNDLWFRQAVHANRTLVSHVTADMINRFKDSEQRFAFQEVRVTSVSPIYKPNNDEIIGMLVIYHHSPNTLVLLTNPTTRARTEEINLRIAMVLSYDYVTNEEVKSA
jgi:hypothetical protein